MAERESTKQNKTTTINAMRNLLQALEGLSVTPTTASTERNYVNVSIQMYLRTYMYIYLLIHFPFQRFLAMLLSSQEVKKENEKKRIKKIDLKQYYSL